ncbi:copper resistance CopC family protein [Falsiroseomonas oryziterrae]|uniref:copper resistance CopC family protein n=1 Tax=Falsiroseomonas oryziterrae TaxID=2911368 RepID=UPI001F231777|nr:copper resistance CopC family protein [Roseomonas sp. NPKOSM-4]
MSWTRRGAALAALGVIGGRGAAAHSLLLGSQPAEGAALTAAPEAIALRFNEPVQLTALRLFAADGAEWPLRRPRDLAPRPEHRAAIGRELTPGAWRAVWRAISADGHEIGGTLRFRLEAPR